MYGLCLSLIHISSDAETLQAELDALLAVQQAGGTLTAPSDGTLVSLDLVVGQPSPAAVSYTHLHPMKEGTYL